MRQIKAITDFGILPVRQIGAKKEIAGEYWAVCEVPTKYMNAAEPIMMRRVLHYKTGANLPIQDIRFNETGKAYLEAAARFLSSIPLYAVKKEVGKYETINE